MALTDQLTAIGNAIRAKTGGSALIPLNDMPTEIANIPGGNVPSSALSFSGNLEYLFYNDNWNWFLDLYGDQLQANNVTSMSYMFLDSKLLEELPITFLSNIDYTAINNSTGRVIRDIFTNCWNLRRIPKSVLSHIWNNNGSSAQCTYTNLFSGCYALEEADGIYPADVTANNGVFANTFNNCMHISRIKFITGDNNTPFVRNWKSQTINLSGYIGYSNGDTLKINTTLTAATEVTDATSYASLKNNPDWWTKNYAYSRYNHDSAVETINSLPDTSAYIAQQGGTNTIKFKGTAGSATDGGAINTLTSAEIAVATAKGWTVSLI